MPAETPEDVENILFIFTDQQRLDSLGCYGNDWVETPNLDRLATEGACFDNAYTPAAICSPARASVLSGVRPFQHGIERNVGPDSSLADDFSGYPRSLNAAGLNVGHVGKWHVGGHPEDFEMDGELYPGWAQPLDNEDYLTYLDERDLPHPTPDRFKDVFPQGGVEYQEGAVDDRPREAHFTSFLTERGIEQLEAYTNETEPFYLSVQYFGPHNPYYLPEEYLHMYDPEEINLPESAIKETLDHKPWAHKMQKRKAALEDIPVEDWRRIIAAYHGWVTFIDDEVGRLLDALERLGVADSTAVVFSSDHGSFLTAHKMHDKGPAMYEDIYNIPFIATGLGNVDESAFVSLLDLAPTFCDWADAAIPESFEGQSLLECQPHNDGWRSAIVCEFHGHQFAYEQRMIRADSYKLVCNEYDTAELYDLEADPHELKNRIIDPAYGDIGAALWEQMEAKLAEIDDPFLEGEELKRTKTVDIGLDPYEPSG